MVSRISRITSALSGLVVGLALCGSALAQGASASGYTGPLFDAHLHYNDEAQAPHPPSGESFGLRSVRDRLRGHFGGDASLDLVREQQATVARIRLPLVEQTLRFEIDEAHGYREGIDESMSIDECKHSLFGASKVASDILVQEYGRYFQMKTACFRAGCITGPNHSGAQLHGFLAYLMKCTVTGTPYTIFGYRGKQVRDNIHAADLVAAFAEFFKAPRVAEVYNIGGGRRSNCSVLEGIALCEELTGKRLSWTYSDAARSGDHIWWISDVGRFVRHYPGWCPRHSLREMGQQIFDQNCERWT